MFKLEKSISLMVFWIIQILKMQQKIIQFGILNLSLYIQISKFIY